MIKELLLVAALATPVAAQGHARGMLYARAEGAEARVAIVIEIDPGWHLYHGPAAEDVSPDDPTAGLPTRVELAGEGFEWGPIEYPAPHEVEIDLGSGPIRVRQHEQRLVLRSTARIPAGADVAAVTARVKGLTCQDDGVCIPYGETLKVSGAGHDALFAATVDPVREKPAPAPAQPEDIGLWLFLLSAVGWGLFTLLMPCTYPMIPITISYFTKQASRREAGTLPLSLAYGAGIVLVFVLIGVVIGPAIIEFAVHPVTNIVIAALFLLFALVLFGLIDLQPPAFLMNAAGRASSVGGYGGVFLMGATLVVTSFTCTAPFVGTLLATGASSGDLGRVALGMGVFGLTMALPFVYLSTVPQKVRALPRSGEWMHSLKVTLGFVEVAAALKFVSNVDLVWGWGWLSRELFLFLWMGIFLVAGLYLFGQIRMQGEETAAVSPGRMVAGLGMVLFGLYCGYGALGNSMDDVMTAIAPNYSGSLGGEGKGGAPVSRHIIIKDDYESALARAEAEGKQLLVNFTGYT